MPSEFLNAKPVLRISGVADPELSGLLISVRATQAEDGVSRLELRLINLTYTADEGLVPVFGANAPWQPGSAIELAMEDAAVAATLFRGTVHHIEHIHPEAGKPEVLLRAADARQVPSPPADADIPLSVGGALLSARVVESPSSLRIEGVSVGDPAIRVGCVVAVRGLAPQLATRYRVNAVTQLVDATHGYRTEFTGVPPIATREP